MTEQLSFSAASKGGSDEAACARMISLLWPGAGGDGVIEDEGRIGRVWERGGAGVVVRTCLQARTAIGLRCTFRRVGAAGSDFDQELCRG